MKNVLSKTLLELARQDERMMLLTGDLGFNLLEPFIKEFPNRYINMGVAEQNMLSVAAGLSIKGKIPFVYSITPFASLRPLEQIRNDICYQKQNVRILAMGSGYSYAQLGITHWGLEDIGVLRSLSNLTIISPGDTVEAKTSLLASLDYQGPIYYRLGKTNNFTTHDENNFQFKIGKGYELSVGSQVAIICSGKLLHLSLTVAESLEKKGISVRLISMPTIKPLDKEIIFKAINETEYLCTIEDHNIVGGLGTAVAEVIAEQNNKVKFKRFAYPDSFPQVVGSQKYLESLAGLDEASITQSILHDINI